MHHLQADLHNLVCPEVVSPQKGFGIVTWHTRGFIQRDELAIDYKRTNLVRQRDTA